MANARSIIERALRKIHVLGRGQTLSAEEAQDALKELNSLISSLSADAVYIFNSTRETFSLTGAASYTIGAGGDFNTARPVAINSMTLTIGSTDYPVVQKNAAEYAVIGSKEISGTPEIFYYENNTPLGRIFLYPAGVAGYTLGIDSLKALDSFADLTTIYDLPDSGDDVLVYNLAVRLAPDYETEASPTVKVMAKRSLQSLQVFNKRNNYPTSVVDFGKGLEGNILSGWYAR